MDLVYGPFWFVGPDFTTRHGYRPADKSFELTQSDGTAVAFPGFEGALGRVVQNVPGELSDEFSRMLQETRVGVSRNAALKSLAERTDVDDLNTFIMALTQADAFGVSISRMLRVQADEMRVRRRLRAQERAFAAPVKMTFPLVLCIFPGIFTVLLGPAAIQISDALL